MTNLPDTRIAAILYTLRDYCQTESDLDKTLDRLCGIGYQAVQVSGCPLEAEVIRRQLDKHGVFCCGTHIGFDKSTGNLQPLIDYQRALGCDFAATGGPPEEWRGTAERVQATVDLFNRVAPELKAAGIRLAYHNHHFEFRKLEGLGGKTVLDYFYANTDPETVCGEIDTHWVVRGGTDPVGWIKRLAGRMPVIHFKDFTVMEDNTPAYCEIGMGNLDWPAIVAACEETGVRWYSIEQDNPFPGRDIFDSLKLSFDYLRSIGVR